MRFIARGVWPPLRQTCWRAKPKPPASPTCPRSRWPVLRPRRQGRLPSALIGPRGEALNSLQYVLRLMSGHQLHKRVNILLDVANYRERRRQALARLATRMAEKVSSKNRPVTLEPMPPFERRVIHMTLREEGNVYTQSIGNGDQRRVRIYPKRD